MNPRKVLRAEALVTPFHSNVAVTTSDVATGMSTALKDGDAVVCIASGSQRRRLEEQMRALGIDVVGALMREQLVCLNAFDTLLKVIVNDVPDVIRFAEVIGAVLDRAATRYPRVLTFSELASVSLKNGDVSGALKLEMLLTSFLDSRPLFFRYPNRAFCFDLSATETSDYRSMKRVQFS
jgi:MEDS: MEthanogen/methylotroph, DcmR Sensory domain